MALSKRDREFRLPKISYLDVKLLEMDRVLTAFFARLAHNGFPSRLRRKAELTTEAFVEEFLEHPEWFTGFAPHREILSRWIETHLMDVVNRGKPGQAIAAPRPLHGFTYRFRNPKHSRDYGAAQHLYEQLHGARAGTGQKALEHLDHFFFQGHDKVTGRADQGATLDVETQALLRLLDQVEDAADTRAGRESHPPLCVGAADLLADDVMRLLFYQRFVPRSVMVEYLKVLLAFQEDERLAQLIGQRVLPLGKRGLAKFNVTFRVDPHPSQVQGLDKLVAQVVSKEHGPVGLVRSKSVWKSARTDANVSFSKLGRVDWEEGWHFVRVLAQTDDGDLIPLVDADGNPIPWAADDDEIVARPNETDLFYVLPDGEVDVDPPQRAVQREASVVHALTRVRFSALIDDRDPDAIGITSVDWA